MSNLGREDPISFFRLQLECHLCREAFSSLSIVVSPTLRFTLSLALIVRIQLSLDKIMMW